MAAGLALAVLYSGWWGALSVLLQGRLNDAMAQARKAGWVVETGSQSLQGFPWRVQLALGAPVLADALGREWQGPPTLLILDPLRPSHILASFAGRQLILGARAVRWEVMAKAAQLDVIFGELGPGDITLNLKDLVIGAAQIEQFALHLHGLRWGRVASDVPTLAAEASLRNLVIPKDPRLVLGHRLANLQARLRLLGSLVPGPLQDAATVWRDDGGSLEIDGLELDWPPLSLSGTGTLALDRELQPMLASSLSLRGLPLALDMLIQSGLIPPKEGLATKVVLGLMSKPATDGTPQWTVPLNITDRQLSVGPLNLFRLSPLDWSSYSTNP